MSLSVTSFSITSAFFVAIIVSCSVSRIPTALYVFCPAVKGNTDLLLVELDVNLNSTSPVLNLGTFS